MIAKIDINSIRGFFVKPFPLLEDSKSKLFLVVFCGIFSTFFIIFYNPFNLRQINYDSALGNVLSIWTAGILGAIILSFTQFYLRKKAGLTTFTVWQFILWGLFEFACLCIGAFIIFGESKEPFLQEFLLILRYTVSLAIIPYIIACLLIAVTKLSAKLRQEENTQHVSSGQHVFRDENGEVRFALQARQILFLKSENNYTSIFYLQNGKVERKLIRNNLKKLELELDYPDLIRIHRSYMVNIQCIASIHRNKGGFQIQLDQLPDTALKVSETYKNAFEAKIRS